MKDCLFKGYVSNTCAAFGAQHAFAPDSIDETYTGRVFYRIFAGGQYQYRLFFGNTIDSTFGEGNDCHPNEICDSWIIHSAKVAVCPLETDIASVEFEYMQPLTFLGFEKRTVMPGEIFSSDDVVIKANKNDYLCLEITYSGTKIPCLEEAPSTIPTFLKKENSWIQNYKTPGAFLVGCKRDVKKHIAFLGDSITMGCGTTPDAYKYWMARIAERIGENYACWNLGIGYAKCSDAASDGAWLFKAKQADFVNVCLGTNDLLQNRDADQIVNELHFIVDKLTCAGCMVGLFTAPPFYYTGEQLMRWEKVNYRINKEFLQKTVYVYDTCKILDSVGDLHGIGKYEPHPNDEGCRLLSEDFIRFVKDKKLFD